jgi:hypothetical protein
MLFIEVVGYGPSPEDRQTEQLKCVAMTKILVEAKIPVTGFQIYGLISATYNCSKLLKISYDSNDKNRFRLAPMVQLFRNLGFAVFWQQIQGYDLAKLPVKSPPAFV